MHHMRKTLDRQVSLHFHGAESADPANVVSAQIHQHVVLRQLLLIGKQLRLQSEVLFCSPAPGAGAGQRKGMEDAVLQLHQGFWRGAGQLDVIACKVKHVGRGIFRAQDTVGVQKGPFKTGLQAVGEHDLEDISLTDVLFGPFHHCAVGRLVE